LIEVTFSDIVWAFVGSLGGVFVGAVAMYLDMLNKDEDD